MEAASIHDTITAINKACKSRGEAHAQYSCKTVSWDDVQRGTVGGSLSSWGSNITDTRLWEKNGKQLFTVRPENWNEKLGKITTGDVALLVGNEARGGSELRPITLRQYLKNIGSMYGAYAGMKPGTSLHDDILDNEVSIRFQTTFLPVDGDGSSRETLQFAPEAYNYCTQDDKDPRNLVLIGTTQGTALQQDGKGAKKLFHHAVDESGQIHRYWLEAEASDHKVGGAQKETEEEKADALTRGKATASVIGVKAMGTRFNCLMTIQVPLAQKPKPRRRKTISCCSPPAAPSSYGGYGGFGALGEGCSDDDGSEDGLFGGFGGVASTQSAMFDESEMFQEPKFMALQMPPMTVHHDLKQKNEKKGKKGKKESRTSTSSDCRIGRATAARVSRGSEVDVWAGLSVQEPKRNAAEHVTVTVVIYNTVVGGVPSEGDVTAAVEDMESLYQQCAWSGRLDEDGAAFMKAELTVADTGNIASKIKAQPYAPPSFAVGAADIFPQDDPMDLLGAPDQPVAAVHSNIICDVCDPEHPIVGRRYHKKGEDFDLCEAEFLKLCQFEQLAYEMISQPGAKPIQMA